MPDWMNMDLPTDIRKLRKDFYMKTKRSIQFMSSEELWQDLDAIEKYVNK
jgi:hypothetical protein